MLLRLLSVSILLFYIFFTQSASLNAVGSLLDSIDCPNVADKVEAAKCVPLWTEFLQKSIRLNQTNLKVNDTNVLNLIKVCHKVQLCIEPTCASETSKNIMDIACISFEIKNTGYSKCESILKTNKPDTSNYTCMDGLTFGSKEYNKIALTTNKECTKTIMKDFCGEEYVTNFDNDLALKNKFLNRTASSLIQFITPLLNKTHT